MNVKNLLDRLLMEFQSYLQYLTRYIPFYTARVVQNPPKLAVYIPYILESNPHTFYSFRVLKNQMRIRIACGLDSRSWAGLWKNDRATVRGVRTIKYNHLLFYLLFIILYNIYNLLFIRLAVITHNWIVFRHPVTQALVTSNIIQSVCLVGKGRLKERCGLEPRNNFSFV